MRPQGGLPSAPTPSAGEGQGPQSQAISQSPLSARTCRCEPPTSTTRSPRSRRWARKGPKGSLRETTSAPRSAEDDPPQEAVHVHCGSAYDELSAPRPAMAAAPWHVAVACGQVRLLRGSPAASLQARAWISCLQPASAPKRGLPAALPRM